MIYDLPPHVTAREKAMGYHGDSGAVVVLKETLERLEKEYL